MGSDTWQKTAWPGRQCRPGDRALSYNRGHEGKGTDRRELAAALHRRAAGRIRRTHPADQLRRLPGPLRAPHRGGRSEEHTSELQSLMRISYAVFCLKKKNRDIRLTIVIE